MRVSGPWRDHKLMRESAQDVPTVAARLALLDHLAEDVAGLY
jgi:hypothetical protein